MFYSTNWIVQDDTISVVWVQMMQEEKFCFHKNKQTNKNQILQDSLGLQNKQSPIPESKSQEFRKHESED